ncbi:hypothetical protein AKO1_006080 [Acrasis kona]|uniref:Uncharacterized protein n=1 Tax=Acrasis kona TaxID=1008807 RepID=A0AAW2YKN9_9EUKA
MGKSSTPAIAVDNVAVITGSASGIGLAVAKHLASKGMKIYIVDSNEALIENAKSEVVAKASSESNVRAAVADVTKIEEIEKVCRDASEWGFVTFVMNNAAIQQGGGTFENIAQWRKLLDVNLYGVLNGVQTFVPYLIQQKRPAIIVNTGSKQGITNPPGNGAYNVSKSAVKTLTEHLAYELRSQETNITAHLLVPGYTWTGMTGANSGKDKPNSAWNAEQVAEFLLQSIDAGDFYIICPDNDVDRKLDEARMQWAADDIIQNRSALSRWDPKYKQQFEDYVKSRK